MTVKRGVLLRSLVRNLVFILLFVRLFILSGKQLFPTGFERLAGFGNKDAAGDDQFNLAFLRFVMRIKLNQILSRG